MHLKNTKLMFTAKEVPEMLKHSAIKLKIGLDSEKIKNIFSLLLRQNMDHELHVPQQGLQKIANVSFEICRKVTQEQPEEMKEGFNTLRRIFAGFAALKIKESHNIMKEVDRFWSFALQEALRSYDTHHILEH